MSASNALGKVTEKWDVAIDDNPYDIFILKTSGKVVTKSKVTSHFICVIAMLAKFPAVSYVMLTFIGTLNT